jgi:hypothetical protein
MNFIGADRLQGVLEMVQLPNGKFVAIVDKSMI